MKNTNQRISFEEWLKRVDEILIKKVGVGQDNLPNWLSRDEWESGTSPEGGAEECLSQI